MLKLLKQKVLIAISAFLLFLPLSGAKAAVIELALVIDGSTALGSSNFALQRDAYASIFSDDFYTNYVSSADTLYVSVYQFSNQVSEVATSVLIDSDTAAEGLAATIAAMTYLTGGSTRVGNAVNYAVEDLITNSITSDRMVIDVSIGTTPYYNASAISAASNAVDEGVTVNAIGVGTAVSETFLQNFTTAGNGFYMTAANFQTFEDALSQKLYKEVYLPSVNAPTSMYGLFILAAFGFMGRRIAR